MGKNRKRVVTIPPDQWESLDQKAREERTTKSHVLTKLIANYIEEVAVW